MTGDNVLRANCLRTRVFVKGGSTKNHDNCDQLQGYSIVLSY
jgi:hypothetical protein